MHLHSVLPKPTAQCDGAVGFDGVLKDSDFSVVDLVHEALVFRPK